MAEQAYKIGPALEGQGYTVGPPLDPAQRFQPEAIIGATPETIDSGTAGLPAPHGVPRVSIFPPNVRPPISAPPEAPPQPQPEPAPNPNRIKAIVGAFGQGWDESTSQEKLGLSDSSFNWLQRVGVFKGAKDDGPLAPLKSFNEMLIGGSAMMLDAALRTPGGIYRGAQAALHEMGVAGDIVSLPDAFAGSPESGMRPGAAAEKPEPLLVPPKPSVKPSPILPVAGSPFADVPRSLVAKTGIPEVDRVLLSPATKTVIDNAVVDRTRDIPNSWGGDAQLNDPTTYMSKHFPKTLTVNGVTFDPAEPAILHENVEHKVITILRNAGMRPDEALQAAYWGWGNPVEHAWYRAHGMDPEQVEAVLRPILDRIATEKGKDIPDDLFRGTYPDNDPQKASAGDVPKPTPAELERAMAIIRNDHTLGPVDKAPMLQQARELGVIGPERKPLNEMKPEDAGRVAQYGPRNPEQAPRPGEPGGPAEQPSPWRQRLRQTFDKMDTPQAVRDVMEKAIDESGDEFANVRKGTLTPTETASLAEAFGLDPSEINPGDTGKQLIKTSAQIRNAVELVRTADSKIHEISIQIKAKQGVDDAAEIAQLVKLNMQRDMIVKQALIPFIALRSEFGRTGNVIQEFMNLKKPEEIEAFMKAKGSTIKSLDDAREFANLIANTDPELVPSVMSAKSRGAIGKVYWAWVNGLISGVITHSKYVAANETFSMYERGVVTPIAAILSKGRYLGVPGRAEKIAGDQVYMGEAFAGAYGQIASVPLSFYSAVQSVKAGVRLPMDDEIALYQAAKDRGEKVPTPIAKAIDAFGLPQERPITGPLGRAVGAPGDVAGGIHFFYKLRGREAAMQSLAYKETINEGYRPTDSNFFARMQWHYANPTDAMREQAIAEAYRSTFMDELGERGKLWSRAIKNDPLLRWVFPFNHIPFNLAKRTYEGTPLAILDKDMRADLTGKNGGAAESKAMARIIAGSSFMGYVTMLAMGGKATGDYPLDAESRNDWNATGKQPNSVMIGNEWVSFDKFGPTGSLASFGANIAQTIQRAEQLDDDAMAYATFSASVAASRIMVDQVGWQTMGNFFKALHSEPESMAFWTNLTTSFMPYSSLIEQQASEADPYMRQAKTFTEALKYRTPFLRDTLLPKLDILGDPIPNPQYGNIIRQTPVQTDPIFAELLNAKIHIAPPVDRVAGDVKLPPRLYFEYQQKAGIILRAQISQFITQPGWERLPLFVRQETLRGAIEASRQAALAQMITQHQEIMWQGLNQTLNKVKGQPPPPPLHDAPAGTLQPPALQVPQPVRPGIPDSPAFQPSGILGIRG